MSRKDNFRKAAFDMLGVGRDVKPQAEEAEDMDELTAGEELDAGLEELFSQSIRPAEAIRPAEPKYQTTVLAAGSVFEGTLRATGNVDLACEFKWDIFAEGDVVMRTSLDGNVEGKRVELISCAIHGDIKAGAQVRVDRGSSVKGNVTTKDLTCSGKVEGDIIASGHVVLESDAVLAGNLTAATLSIDEGAAIEGSLKVSRAQQG